MESFLRKQFLCFRIYVLILSVFDVFLTKYIHILLQMFAQNMNQMQRGTEERLLIDSNCGGNVCSPLNV